MAGTPLYPCCTRPCGNPPPGASLVLGSQAGATTHGSALLTEFLFSTSMAQQHSASSSHILCWFSLDLLHMILFIFWGTWSFRSWFSLSPCWGRLCFCCHVVYSKLTGCQASQSVSCLCLLSPAWECWWSFLVIFTTVSTEFQQTTRTVLPPKQSFGCQVKD